MYCWVAALIKLSLCVFFLRIFSPSFSSRLMTWSGIVLIAVSYVALFIAWMASSVPLPGETGWTDFNYINRSAETNMKLAVALGVVGTFTDFYTLAIPLTAISGLKMSVARKIAISGLFATGLLYGKSTRPLIMFFREAMLALTNIHPTELAASRQPGSPCALQPTGQGLYTGTRIPSGCQ